MRRKGAQMISPDPVFGGLWDYSFYDRSTGLYLVYRAQQRPILIEEEFDHPNVAPQDTLIVVPHSIMYIGMTPIARGTIVANELPPPPRGWPESYKNQKLFEEVSKSLISSFLPF